MGKIEAIPNLEIYGPTDPNLRISAVSFKSRSLGAHAIAKVLCQRGNIMIRSGFHCAQPLHDRLKIPPSARASFYLYNTEEEIETMIDLLKRVVNFL